MADPSHPILIAPPSHPDSARLFRAIGRCTPLSARFTGILYRAAGVRRANSEDLVAGVGSLLTGGRWNPMGAFRTIYTSLHETTALDESRQQNLRQGVAPWMSLPVVVTAVDVDLDPVLDLIDGRVRRILRVTRERMVTERWWTIQEEGQEAITQAIGHLARDQGYVAILVPSIIHPSAVNMVIFPERLTAANRLVIINSEELPPRIS